MKRVLSIMISLAMLLTMSSVGVYATDMQTGQEQEESQGYVMEDEAVGDEVTEDEITEDEMTEDETLTEEPAEEEIIEETVPEEEQLYEEEEELAADKKGASTQTATSVNISLKVKAVSDTKAQLKLSGTIPSVFSVEVYKKGQTTPQRVVQGLKGAKVTITGLTKGERYRFRVVSATGQSKLSKSVLLLVKPDKPESFKAYSSYESVELEWSKVKGADGYQIKRAKSGKKLKVYKERTKKWKKFVKKGSKIKWSNDVKMYQKYVYQVRAYKEAADGTRIYSEPTEKEGKACVEMMRTIVKLKINKKLTCHDRKKKTIRLSAGTKIMTDGYLNGRYIFHKKINGYNHTFFVSKIACTNQRSIYIRKGGWNYSKSEAERFVKKMGLTSSTKYMIWVSRYTQHVFVFKKKSGKWKVIDQWECSTGNPSTPTVTGKKQIYKYWPTHNGAIYWNVFSGEQALHSHVSTADLGNLASHGCVRNPDHKAIWIHKNCKMGTRVLIY